MYAFGQVPTEVACVPVEGETGALGLVFAYGGDPAVRVKWHERMGGVNKRLTRISRLGSSAFGGAQCTGAYAVSRVLFHAGHTGMPDDTAEQLWRRAVALADKGIGPESGL